MIRIVTKLSVRWRGWRTISIPLWRWTVGRTCWSTLCLKRKLLNWKLIFCNRFYIIYFINYSKKKLWCENISLYITRHCTANVARTNITIILLMVLYVVVWFKFATFRFYTLNSGYRKNLWWCSVNIYNMQWKLNIIIVWLT